MIVITGATGQLGSGVIENLIQKRNEYRLSKNWEEADKIKNNLLKIKVAVKDGKETTEWKIIK